MGGFNLKKRFILLLLVTAIFGGYIFINIIYFYNPLTFKKDQIISYLADNGCTVEEVKVPHEFQTNANSMLKIKKG
jgi:hypothetical protein